MTNELFLSNFYQGLDAHAFDGEDKNEKMGVEQVSRLAHGWPIYPARMRISNKAHVCII